MKRYSPKFKFENKSIKEEKYWFIDSEGKIIKSGVSPFADSWDMNRWKLGNCFKHKIQAREAAKRIKKTLIQYHKEINQK